MATKSEVKPADLESSNDETLIVSLVFSIGLYADVPFSKIAAPTLKIWNKFQALAGKNTLNFYATDTMSKHKPVTPRALGMLGSWLAPGAPDRESVGIAYQASEEFNSAPRWIFEVLGSELADADDPSAITLGFPVEYGTDRHEEMEKLFMELCGLAPFRTARAGFTFLCSRYWERDATEEAWAKSMRHPGVDIHEVTTESLMIRRDAIMGVNWLTYVDGRFVKQLGGLGALESAAKAAKTAKSTKGGQVDLISASGGGVTIRAGDKPRLGDVNRGDDLPDYKVSFKLLKPLIDPVLETERLKWLDLKRDEEQRTLDWLNRHGR